MTAPVARTAPARELEHAVALTATGRLRELNLAGVLDASDVHVARRLARLGGERDETVAVAAALAVRAVRGGSTCVDLADPGDLDEPLGVRRVSAALEASPLTRAGVLRLEGTLLYLARYWDEETQVVRDLASRDETRPAVDETVLAAALAAYFPDDGSADQRAAAEVACRRWTSVLTGGPGTGKTTTIARLLGVLLSLEEGRPPRVALAAPTGKAAARMAQAVREATDRADFPGAAPAEPAAGPAAGPSARRRDRIRAFEATTLHRLLGWRPDSSTRFKHGRGNPLPFDVVIVDETSMVSLTMTARLLEAMRPQARLVLVGDAHQLASVEAGAVLHDVVRGWSGGPVSALRVTRRFGRNIRDLATAVREGRDDDVVAMLGEGRAAGSEGDGTVHPLAVPGGSLDELLRGHAVAVHDAAAVGDAEQALAAFEAHRLLCAHREGPFGIAVWNRHVERLLMDALGVDWLPVWYSGRPFIVNGNDRGLGLWNGDTGVTCRVPGRAGTAGVVGDRSSPMRTLATTRLADVTTAHAMTVHRSQGSQFAEVTLVLPDARSRLLTRELFYTAVTRARSAVRVVGTEEAVRAAVRRRARRATGLAERLS